MNKQTLIDDYKQTIERLQKECTEKTDLNIKLMERVKELEQKLDAQFAEMEEKLTAEENKNYELKEENETLKAQVETFKNLMSVYKDISKGRQDSEYVNNYITALKCKLKIAEEALNDIKNSFFKDEDKEIITHTESIYYYSKAQETLQKIKEEK